MLFAVSCVYAHLQLHQVESHIIATLAVHERAMNAIVDCGSWIRTFTHITFFVIGCVGGGVIEFFTRPSTAFSVVEVAWADELFVSLELGIVCSIMLLLGMMVALSIWALCPSIADTGLFQALSSSRGVMALISAVCLFFPSMGVAQCLADGGDLVTGVDGAVRPDTPVGTGLARTDSSVQTDMLPATENAGTTTQTGVQTEIIAVNDTMTGQPEPRPRNLSVESINTTFGGVSTVPGSPSGSGAYFPKTLAIVGIGAVITGLLVADSSFAQNISTGFMNIISNTSESLWQIAKDVTAGVQHLRMLGEEAHIGNQRLELISQQADRVLQQAELANSRLLHFPTTEEMKELMDRFWWTGAGAGAGLSTYHNFMTFVTRNQVLIRRFLLRR